MFTPKRIHSTIKFMRLELIDLWFMKVNKAINKAGKTTERFTVNLVPRPMGSLCPITLQSLRLHAH